MPVIEVADFEVQLKIFNGSLGVLFALGGLSYHLFHCFFVACEGIFVSLLFVLLGRWLLLIGV